jgi:hypothetical protein
VKGLIEKLELLDGDKDSRETVAEAINAIKSLSNELWETRREKQVNSLAAAGAHPKQIIQFCQDYARDCPMPFRDHESSL